MNDETENSSIPQAPGPDVENGPGGSSRGDFLKWGTVALSGLYVGPKITSFAMQGQLGHAGSVPVTPTPPAPTPIPPSPPPLPTTGGAAERRASQARQR